MGIHADDIESVTATKAFAPRSRISIVALAGAVAILAALCTYLLCAVFTQGSNLEEATIQSERADTQQESSSSKLPVGTFLEYDPTVYKGDDDLKMPFTYSTAYGAITGVTYPSFSFSFPDAWHITHELVEPTIEEVELQRGGSDIKINYSYVSSVPDATNTRLVHIRKVADSAFWPGYVQGNNHTDLGRFMVAEVVLAKPSTSEAGEPDTFVYFAVLPESALALPDAPGLDITSGMPGFDYSGLVTLWSLVPGIGISDADRTEIVTILSSFTTGMDEDDYWSCVEASLTNQSASRVGI